MEVTADQTLLFTSGTSRGSRSAQSRVWPHSFFLPSSSDQQLIAKTCLERERANVIKSRTYPRGSGLRVVFEEV